MRSIFRRRAAGATLLVVAIIAAACGSGDGATNGTDDATTSTASGDPIVITSFNFNESTIVAEIYAQALEAEGIPVSRNLNIGSREIVKPALESGEIDLVPEYVGTLDNFLGGTPSADSAATWSEAKALFEPAGVTLLDYAPAQDKNAYVVTAETAAELGLSKVSDLAPVAGRLVFGGPPECPEREACLKGLEDVYGLTFAEFKPLDVAGPLTVTALEGGEIDVALLFSTQGIIADKGWIVLEDDRGLNPAENVTPAIRIDVLNRYPQVAEILNRVSAALTTEELTALNSRADIDQEDPSAIAADWLAQNGFTA